MSPLGFDTTLTLAQSLQLAGFIPSVFLVVLFLSLAQKSPQTVIPTFYFVALACGFALPLLQVYSLAAHDFWLEFGLRAGKSTLVSFSFLLICQFMLGRIPPPAYWLVLAIPVVGGSPLIYADMLHAGNSCRGGEICSDTTAWRVLYGIVSSAFVFLLLVYQSSRAEALHSSDIHRSHKYWLIIALIMLNLLMLAIGLAQVAGYLTQDKAEFAGIIFRLSFIYLVLTSLLRVFYPALGHQSLHLVSSKPAYDPEADMPYVEKIKILLDVESVWREMRLNRAALAKKVGIGEHHLSRVINHHFGKNFNELINGYRVEEAKKRLRSAPHQQVTAIAFDIGFNSIASFNRVFREKVGMSPTEYRTQGDADAALVTG